MADIESSTEKQTLEVSPLPHMSTPQIAYLKDKLAQSKCFLEFGAGGSSILASSMNVPHIYSVESDKSFAATVNSAVKNSESRSSFLMSAVDIGDTGHWGKPLNFDRLRHWSKYSLEIWSTIAQNGHSPDLILVDGRFRVACVLASLIFCKDDTTIIVDDYSKRVKRYGVIENYTGGITMIDRMAVVTAKAGRDKLKISLELSKYINDER